MNNVKRQLMVLCSTIFALLLVLSTASVSAAQGNTWTTMASMNRMRSYHQAFVINGKIYVVGGSDSSVEEYNPKRNVWTTKASMSTDRILYQAAAVDGKIYVIGGRDSNGPINSVEEFDPETNTWTLKASMSGARMFHKLAVVNEKIYVIGGISDDANPGNPLNLLEEYDPATNTWSIKESMNLARQADIHISVISGKIYVVGGAQNSSNLVEEYDPVKNTWTYKTPMSAIRTSFESVVIDGKIYILGGKDVSSNMLDTVEEYDPMTNIWVTKASMRAARNSFNAVVVNGKIYAIGGAVDKGSVEEYTPANNTWTDKASIASDRSNFETAIVNEKIYTIGGYKSDYQVTDSVEEYTCEYPAPLNFKAAADNGKVNLFWNECENATNYIIKRSEKSGNSYKTIASTPTATFTDTSVTSGTTYYYVVSAVKNDVESPNSVEVSATPKNSGVTLEVTSADRAKLGGFITANVVIHDAVNICAEDIKVAFDTSKLEFVSAENAYGIKLCKEDSLAEDKRRYITASLGKGNAANGDKILLKLTFKAKALGEAKIDIISGRIADNATLENDIEESNCGEKIVSIMEENSKDVNRSGEFTLLDLGIDAWYYGDAAANTDTSKYDADVVANGTIDDNDLAEIVKQILSNSNYPAVSKG